MGFQARRRKLLGIGFVALIAMTAVPRPVQAQYGMGTGMGMGMGMGCWGWGWGAFSQVPKPESYLYQKSLVDAERALQTRSYDSSANGPNSYMDNLRDNRAVGSYTAARFRPSARRDAARPRVSPTSLTLPQQPPAAPLASFYGPNGKFGWPADAPIAGDLALKRAAVESACQAVLDEVKQNAGASIAKVADARQKLLDYGRPALQYARVHQTPRVAEGFHQFLLSLYESLAQTVNPAGASAAATQPVPSS
jgi:hypothetical protein